MIRKQVDEACFRMADLISNNTPLVEVVNEAKRLVQSWEGQAVALFQFWIQDTADEMSMQLPAVEKIERDGLRVSISVDDTPAHAQRMPIEGVVVGIEKDITILLAVVSALEAEMAGPTQSLGGHDHV